MESVSRKWTGTKWLIAAGFGLVLLLVLVYGLRGEAPLEGRPAPNFTLELFDGSSISLDDLRGRVVVLNFWASWCEPCRDEAAVLERVWRDYQDRGVVFVGINAKDVRKGALGFMEKFDITYPNGPDPYDRISRAYRVYAFPETYVVTADGRVHRRYIGAISELGLREALDELLRP